MDQTKRPLRIPPEFSSYAEQHGIFDIYKRLLEQLVIQKPNDPIQFMIDELKKDNADIPQIVILGPPASGKTTIAKMLSKKLHCACINMDSLVSDSEQSFQDQVAELRSTGEIIPAELWTQMLKERVKLYDCMKKGFVLEGFPQTREQTLLIQDAGIIPKHCIILEAPDTVLIERVNGKRIDPKTGDVYHTTFDWPSNSDIISRLQKPPNYEEDDIIEELIVYHRHISGITSCLSPSIKTVNADQPKADVFSQIMNFLTWLPRTAAPHTPKIVLLGPTGSGKAVQAALLASKYKIVNVSTGSLIKQAIAEGNKTGNACRPYVEKDMLVPDAIVLKLLQERLTQIDCMTRGFVLHGYPRSRSQAAQMDDAGLTPNRVFMLDIPNDSVLERLTLRALDPITGERYHALYNPPRTQTVKDRLQTHPRDRENEVRARLSQWQAYVDELNEYYEEYIQRINADQDPQTVFECIESMSVKPLPRKLIEEN
ncbi:DgyrCDS12196 [Dimorphilus gyrociliatus]|uniref:DgyrCDS12196 n=1 Tax=Dimorphilus gyrociliatus TaxID=2664684 RepID=A0A7I8W5Q2_9ANNE|nr:DgyrCDS12196 [Dimorphilus gyrociliatus]